MCTVLQCLLSASYPPLISLVVSPLPRKDDNLDCYPCRHSAAMLSVSRCYFAGETFLPTEPAKRRTLCLHVNLRLRHQWRELMSKRIFGIIMA
ncbi:uncharacterized protein BDV17DRAFT_272382 [Aspergillus undulatus]|uniref:uncharacterized protein n=1 Tax=Aspergillus undulatus TaxID=1810928 RepID=UPI003CCD831B